MQIKEESFKVAGHVFSLRMDQEEEMWMDLDNYAPFLYHGVGERVFSLELVEDLSFEGKEALFVPDLTESFERRLDLFQVDGGYLFEMGPVRNIPVCGWLKTTSDFSQAFLKVEKAKQYCINTALMILYTFRTAGMGTLEMHASVTVKDGKGYMFLGKSGTGKSTHSSLWLKNIPGTHLLNDDNPVVRFLDGEARVYGSPWSGKTPCYRNEDYPIGAIVKISRAPYNAIQRLNPLESIASIASASSGLRAIRSVTDSLFSTISSLVETVPCYVMNCLPDDEAALVCANGVAAEGSS